MRDVLHVGCAVEGRYVPHVASMLHSVTSHAGPLDVRVHYLHGGDTTARQQRRLAEMLHRNGAAVEFIEVPDEWVVGLPTKGFTRKATWYRIFLPDLLPDVHRILYLDADLIVVDDLSPLWDIDVDGYYLGAVTNAFPPWLAARPLELGLPSNDRYFNAGVLLMNLEEMRADGCSRRLRDFGVTHGDGLVMRDQDALNAVLGERRLSLHPRWNCMNAMLLFDWGLDVMGREELEEARRDPAIRHFEGPDQNKPWHYLSEPDARALYMGHRRETPWPRLRADGRTPRNVARRMRRARR